MVRDRLSELRQVSGQYRQNDANSTFVEMDASSQNTPLQHTLNEFSIVRDMVIEIRTNTETIKSLVSEIQQTFRNSKQLAEKLEAKRLENMNLCHKVYQAMKRLEVDLPCRGDYSALARIRRNNFYAIRENFLDAWTEHESFLTMYEERLKKELRRQATIMSSNITDEEMDELLTHNTQSLFTGNILEEAEHSRKVLRELVERHSELQKIEKSLVEVRDMFLRISALVMEQSARILYVEHNLIDAKEDVDKGAVTLEKARELKIKGLKRKTCIIIWVVVVFAVLIFIGILF